MFYSLRSKIILWFVALFVAIIALSKSVELYGIPFTDYRGEFGEYQAEEFRKLSLVADLKKERLERWFKEREGDLAVLADSEMMKNAVRELFSDVEKLSAGGKEGDELWRAVRETNAYKNIAAQLNTVKSTYAVYGDVKIASPKTGIVMASTRPENSGLKMEGKSLFEYFASERDFLVYTEKDFKGEPERSLHIAKHMKLSEEMSAAVIAHVDYEGYMQPLIYTGEGLGKTGEALLVDSDRRILSSLKHVLITGETAKMLEYRISEKTPADFAASGKEGVILGRDYRGVLVYAAYRVVKVAPEARWGLVVKTDAEEVMGIFARSAKYTLIVSFCGIVIMIVLTFFAAGRLTRSVRRMRDVAIRVREGDLKARAKVKSRDELGFLAGTFNSMIENVENWHKELNFEVKKRTQDLKVSNESLEKELFFRKRLETERLELIKKLEARNFELEQFTYAVSHDLKSPLITVKGYLYLLEQDIRDSAVTKMKSDMDRIASAVDRMHALLNEVLRVSQAGKLEAFEDVRLEDIAREAAELVHGRVAAKNVTIDILPNIGTVYADRSKMVTVLQNLIDNAAKYTGSQSAPRVQIGARESDGGKVYYVRDNGIGIDARYHTKIFGLFDKLDQKSEGTGVGLALVKRIIEAQGGKVWVESEGEGKGSTFCFTVPEKKGGVT